MSDSFETVVKNYSGESTKTKPTIAAGNNVPNGSRWREVDTGKTYHFNLSTDTWYLTEPGTTDTVFGTAVYDASINELLCNILLEIKKMNIQISLITDHSVQEEDTNDY